MIAPVGGVTEEDLDGMEMNCKIKGGWKKDVDNSSLAPLSGRRAGDK